MRGSDLGDALEVASRLLAGRERTRAALLAALTRRGFAQAAAQEAVERLAAAGAVDDRRAASSRARILAERGYGDAYIRADLLQKGIDAENADSAIGELEPELERARALLGRGARGQTARRLARKGFAEDVVETAFSADVAHWGRQA